MKFINRSDIKYLAGFAVIAAVAIFFLTFGNNYFARRVGGDMTVDLPANTKLVNANWDKDDSLWYLTREMRTDENAETYTYKEDSAFGVLTGKVTLVEHKR